MNKKTGGGAAPHSNGDEAIGRPSDWQEGRYQSPGKPVSPGVAAPETRDTGVSPVISTPVTREDYVDPDPTPKRRDSTPIEKDD